MAIEQEIGGRRIADGYRYLLLAGGALSFRRGTDRDQRHDVQHAGRCALQGSRRDNKFPTALPQRSAGELYVELWLLRTESLSCSRNQGLVGDGSGDLVHRFANASAPRQHYGRAIASRARPLRARDGSHVELRDGE